MRLGLVLVAAILPTSAGHFLRHPGHAEADSATARLRRKIHTQQVRARLAAARAAEEQRPKLRKTVGGATPVPPLTEPNSTTPIVLEVSAFMDGERCALSLYRALAKATHPARVSFHLLQARPDNSPDCLTVFKTVHLPKACEAGTALADAEGVPGEACQQRVLGRSHAWLLDPAKGEGPAHQRGLAGSLLEYNREDAMCLSSDSHMDFSQGWDEIMLSDWASTRNEFAVLSAYPAQIGSRPHYPTGEYIDLCGYFLENGIPRGKTGGNMAPEPGVAPYLTVNWAAGLSFHRCHAERNVPVDWHLRWIFTGEEIDRAVRLFTSGYDMYLPTNIAVTHNYTHAMQMFQRYSNGNTGSFAGRSRERLRKLFETGFVAEQAESHRLAGALGLQGQANFGLGDQRSLEDFVRWGKVNLGGKWSEWMSRQGVKEEKFLGHRFCRNLQRAPVRDEVDLVASVRSKPDTFNADPEGKVKFYGYEETLDVKKAL